MTTRTPSLWESERLTLERSLDLTIASLHAYGPLYRHWEIAYSGGKDSSTVVTLVATLIAAGAIHAPESLTVLYADTRMELPPLQAAAMRVLTELQQRGIHTQVVFPALDDRYFVYMFGRGVPPPKNLFRWCTPQLKVEPMEGALRGLREHAGGKLLMLDFGLSWGECSTRSAHRAFLLLRWGGMWARVVSVENARGGR